MRNEVSIRKLSSGVPSREGIWRGESCREAAEELRLGSKYRAAGEEQ